MTPAATLPLDSHYSSASFKSICQAQMWMNQNLARSLATAYYALKEREFFAPQTSFALETSQLEMLIDKAAQIEGVHFPEFAAHLVQFISEICLDSTKSNDVAYQAFEGLDRIFAIDYGSDINMKASTSGERLYENSGKGVQTSYSSIFAVLQGAKLSQGAHIIDLGSGFGRIGIAAGLWRSDLRFTGFEYVSHRVTASEVSARKTGISDRVHFFQQDLSDVNFEIPCADAYYLYDPFSKTTYEHVYQRLSEVAQQQPTMVIAKADAREQFQRCMDLSGWHDPEVLDQGTLLLYRSA